MTATPTPARRAAAGSALAVFGLVGFLSACSSDDQADASGPQGDAPAATSADASSPFADGSYDATGEYTSPAGPETVGVSLTIADGKVTAVTVEPEATNANSVKFQKAFAEKISDEVVGVPLDGLSVDKVAGASLTSQGFNDAVTKITAEAKA